MWKAPWRRRGRAARRRGADGGGGRRRPRLGRSSIRRHPHGERSSACPGAALRQGRAPGFWRGSVADPSGPGPGEGGRAVSCGRFPGRAFRKARGGAGFVPCRGLGRAVGRFPRAGEAGWCWGSLLPQPRGGESALGSCRWLHSCAVKRRRQRCVTARGSRRA